MSDSSHLRWVRARSNFESQRSDPDHINDIEKIRESIRRKFDASLTTDDCEFLWMWWSEKSFSEWITPVDHDSIVKAFSEFICTYDN